jgi:pimeloyl-ACP methyl ester carboxylesterase
VKETAARRAAARASAARVVLVHGAVERAAGFERVRACLGDLEAASYDRRGSGTAGERELEVLTYDRRGSGTAREGEPAASIARHVADLIDVLAGRPASVVGHSLGGVVALGAALRRPDLVRSVGVYETALPWSSWWTPAERAAMLAEVDGNVRRAGQQADADPERHARRLAAWHACRADVLALFAAPFEWERLATPLVVGVGAASRAPSARDSRRLAAALEAPLLVLPGAGHAAHRTHPELFVGLVRRAVALAGGAEVAGL